MRAKLTHLAFVAATTIVVNSPDNFNQNHIDLADTIERLKLPVVVFGLGSQSRLGQTVADAHVSDTTIRLLRVLSDHAPTIAVRGEFTADLCRHLGITNVEVIGCQSCFLSCRPDFQIPEISAAPDLARSIVNFTYHSQELPLLSEAMAAGATFIGQSSHFEYDLKGLDTVTSVDDLPPSVAALMTKGMANLLADGRLDLGKFQNWIKARFHQFYSMEAWFAKLGEGFDFSMGTRFHGNMASMQAGIPALWLVHDNRTHEFCTHMGLPHAPLQKMREGASFARLVEDHYETSTFRQTFPATYARFHAYLESHGVPHRLAPPSS